MIQAILLLLAIPVLAGLLAVMIYAAVLKAILTGIWRLVK